MKNKVTEFFKNQNGKLIEWMTFFVLLLTLVGAVYIGYIQNEINQKIEKFQDVVEVSAYSISDIGSTNQPIQGHRWLLNIVNVGNVQLYITKYSVNNKETLVDKALLPAGQQQNAWYRVFLPFPTSTQPIYIVINLSDKIGRSWESKTDINYINNEWESTTHEIKCLVKCDY